MRVLTTGFELSTGTTTADLLTVDTTSEAANYDIAPSTTQKHGGTYALRAVRTSNTATGCYAQFKFSAGGSDMFHQDNVDGATSDRELIPASGGSATDKEYFWFRGYIYFATLSTASNALLHLISFLSSGTRVAGLVMRANGLLALYEGTTGTTDMFTPTTGIWYKVVIHVRKTGTANGTLVSINFFTDGTNDLVYGRAINQPSGSSGAYDEVRLGIMPVAFNGSGNVDVYFDDIAINDDRGTLNNGCPADGTVVQVAVPTGDGGTLNFTSTGASSYTEVDEWVGGTAPNAADYLETDVSAAARLTLLSLPAYAGTASGTVTALQVYFNQSDYPASDGALHRGGIRDGSGNDHVPSTTWPGTVGSDPTSVKSISVAGSGTGVGGGTALTNTEFGNMEICIKRAADATTLNRKRIYATAIEVEDNINLALADPNATGTPFGRVI